MLTKKEEEIYANSIDKYNFRKDNFDEFKPKKYYTISEDEEKLQLEKDAINNLLNDYPYHDELPRVSSKQLGQYRSVEYLQAYFVCNKDYKYIIVNIPITYVVGRIAAINYYGAYITDQRINRARFWAFCVNLFLGCILINMILLDVVY